MRRSRALGIGMLVAGIALAGCSTYAPAPLGDGRGTTDLVHFTVPASSMPTRDLAAHRFDPSDGLDVTEVAMLAVANNPDLKVKRDALGVAQAQAFAAGLLPDPQLGLSRDLPSGNAPTEPGIVTTSAFSLGLNYDIGALLTHSATLGAARSTRDQVRLDLLWAEWQTIAQARLLFGQVLATRSQEQRLSREVAALAPFDHQVQMALSAGNLTFDQASAGLNAVSDVRRQSAEASRQRNQAEHDLRLLLGLAPQVPLDLIGTPYDSTTQPTEVQLQQALDELPARRPDLLALKAGYAAQEATLRVAVIAQFPAINVGFTRARDNSDVYTNGFNIGITLPLFNRNRGNIAIEKATRQQLHDDYDARLLGTRSDMLQLQQDLASFQTQVVALTEHTHQLDVASAAGERAWQANLMDWPTYLSIRSNALSADLELITLQQEQATQAIALETLLGGDWTDRALSASSSHHLTSKQQP
ncbi:MAG: TolC family protein [Rhodanobacter sp.]